MKGEKMLRSFAGAGSKGFSDEGACLGIAEENVRAEKSFGRLG